MNPETILSSIISTILGIIIKMVYDKIPLFSRKQKIEEIKKQCPQIYITQPKNSLDLKSTISNSIFYIVDLEIKADTEMEECAKITFTQKEKKHIDFTSKYLLTIQSNSPLSSQLRYLIYERYGQLSISSLNDSILENNKKITLVFNLKDRPQQVLIIFKEKSLIYNIENAMGNLVYPKIKLNKR